MFSSKNQGKKNDIIARMIKMIISHLAIFQATWPKNPRIIKITAMMIKMIARVNNALDKKIILRTLVFPDAYISVVLEEDVDPATFCSGMKNIPSIDPINNDGINYKRCPFRLLIPDTRSNLVSLD
jgi:hypothetical protein